MKKKLITLFIAVCMTFTLFSTAYASEITEDELMTSSSAGKTSLNLSSMNELSADSRLIRFDNSDVIYANRTAPELISKEDIPVDIPVGMVVNDRPEDTLVSAKVAISSNATVNAIYGPYSAFTGLSDDKMLIILDHLKNNFSTTAVNYNGTNCFKFVSGSDTLYMTVAAFWNVTSGLTSAPSGTLATYLNTGNSAMVYASAYKSVYFTYNGIDSYQWNFARFGTQAYYHSGTEIYMNSSVERSYSVDVYGYVIQGPYPVSISVTPTLGVNITNTGTNNSLYFGGYRYSGKGGSSSTTNLGPLIQLGYKTVQALGNVSGLTVSTVYNLLTNLVSLTKGSSGGRTTYLCQPAPLTTTNMYAYTCSTPSPFAVSQAGDYCTIQLGLLGTKVSTTSYIVPCFFAIS